MTGTHPMRIAFSTRKLALLLGGSALLVMFGIWLVTVDFTETRRGYYAPVAGWVTIGFFGLGCAAMLWKLLFGARTALVLTKVGFTYPAYSPDEIPWSLVTDVRSVSLSGNRYVKVDLANETVAKTRRHPANRLANWAEAKAAGPGVTLNASVLSLSNEQLYATLHDHWLAAKAAPIGPTGSKPSAGE
ncbi:MAG: hypothetical protein JNK19_08950 [Tabrizicola sp.]|nr:hypothetical protein [Tabrizicola sp.]